MRTRTFLLSLFVHAAVIGAAMVVRIVATTELPDPPRSTLFMIAAADTPQVEPPPMPRVQPPTAAAASANATPLEAPQTIATEPLEVFDAVPTDAVTIPGATDHVPGALLGPRPPQPAPLLATPQPHAPVRPGGIIRAPQKVHHVAPEYPAIARSARVSGVVVLEALIREDGTVSEVKVLRSVPLLDTPAVEAVRQWRFTPTLLNGVPVQVIMTVTVSFTLN
jgi:periplasmic protein TonB